MKLIPRVVSFLLILGLALPHPALALRIRNGGLEEQTPTTENLKRQLLQGRPAVLRAGGLEEKAGAATFIREHRLVDIATEASDAEVVRAYLETLWPQHETEIPPGLPVATSPYHAGPLWGAPEHPVWATYLKEELFPGLDKVLDAVAEQLGVLSAKQRNVFVKEVLHVDDLKAFYHDLFGARGPDGYLVRGQLSEITVYQLAYRPDILMPLLDAVADPTVDRKTLRDALANPFRKTNDSGNDSMAQTINKFLKTPELGFTDDPAQLRQDPALLIPWIRLMLAANLADASRPEVWKEIQETGSLSDYFKKWIGTPFLEVLHGDRDLRAFIERVRQPNHTLLFFPDNNLELAACLKVAEVLLSANPTLRIVFVPKRDNGGMNDASVQDTERLLSPDGPSIYARLRRYAQESPPRFVVRPGPAVQGMPLHLMPPEVIAAVRWADSILAIGEANTYALNGLGHPHLYLGLRMKWWPVVGQRVFMVSDEDLAREQMKAADRPPVFVRVDGRLGPYYQPDLGGTLFSTIRQLSTDRAGGLEEGLSKHVDRMNQIITARDWADAAQMSKQVVELSHAVIFETERNAITLRQLDKTVQSVQALSPHERPSSTDMDRALRRWEANAIGLLAASSSPIETYLSEATAAHFLSDPESLEGHLWFFLDLLWGHAAMQGRAGALGLSGLPGIEVPRTQRGQEWSFWLDATQILIWTTPREQFDPTQVNVDELFRVVPLQTLPALIAQWDPQGRVPPERHQIPSVLPDLIGRMGRAPLHVRLGFLLHRHAPVANLSGAFLHLAAALAQSMGSSTSAQFLMQEATKRYEAISQRIDPSYEVWRPTFGMTGLEEQTVLMQSLFEDSQRFPTHLAVAETGRVLLMGRFKIGSFSGDANNHLTLLEVGTQKEIALKGELEKAISHNNRVLRNVLLSSDGQRLYLHRSETFIVQGGVITTYDVQTGRRIEGKPIHLPSNLVVFDLAISPDSRTLFVLMGDSWPHARVAEIHAFDLGKRVSRGKPITLPKDSSPLQLIPSPDGRGLYVFFDQDESEGSVVFYNLASGQRDGHAFQIKRNKSRRPLGYREPGYRGHPTGKMLAFSPDKKTLYVGVAEEEDLLHDRIFTFDLSAGVAGPQLKVLGSLHALSVEPEGSLLAVSSLAVGKNESRDRLGKGLNVFRLTAPHEVSNRPLSNTPLALPFTSGTTAGPAPQTEGGLEETRAVSSVPLPVSSERPIASRLSPAAGEPAMTMKEPYGVVTVGGAAALVPADFLEESYAVTVGLAQTEAVINQTNVLPSHVVAVVTEPSEVDKLKENGILADQIVEGWTYPDLAAARQGATRIAQGILTIIHGVATTHVLEMGGALEAFRQQLKDLPPAWEHRLSTETEAKIRQINELSQIGV